MNGRRKRKKVILIAKTTVQDRLYQSLERLDGQELVYKIGKDRERKVRDISQMKCMKDETGGVLMDDDIIKYRWMKYFDNLMNEVNV